MIKSNKLNRNLINWLILKAVSAIAVLYLIAPLVTAIASNADKTILLKTEHIIVFAMTIIFNSDLIDKIEAFSFGNLNAKFASKESVDKIGDRVDTLLLGLILDSYEYMTLQAIHGERNADKYDINRKGEDQLERLINRELIEIKGDQSFLRKHDTTIQLREHFALKEKGIIYLNLVRDIKHK
jgi:hypothetical protein